MELVYREGVKSDIAELKNLGVLAYGKFKSELTDENWNKMNAFLSSDKSYLDLLEMSKCFVCVDNGQIIGMAYLVRNGNPTKIFRSDWSYIRMVGVNPEYTGLSIGKKLTRMCIDYAKENKEAIIALHTSEFMCAARHIYEGLDFKIIEELEPIFGKKYWLYSLKLTE